MSRTAVERMAWIFARARTGQCPTVPYIAQRFEVSRRTILRDIEFMRVRLGVPLRFVRDRHCYACSADALHLLEVSP